MDSFPGTFSQPQMFHVPGEGTAQTLCQYGAVLEPAFEGGEPILHVDQAD
jgi:hypothetical protein